ncbi:kinase-like domain-containing protein [Suillus paluster]|uniref:kinase-like domain-containing protein n=1 Tax=Suillus paluster TaxID=48578 RepID=UPI001B884678|nr:kinase-like domain-containing protein [Suillus paluster]KAG1741503.1 kinase-like domain-containing protein [Suillus paluster]
MLHSSNKRTAQDRLHNERPAKRLTTSSPEEGEVDDSSPPSPLAHPMIPLPPKPAPSKFEVKVKFPFKKKTNGADVPGPSTQRISPMMDRRHGPVVYERSEDDERRIREDDHRSIRSRSHYEQSRKRGGARVDDHWQPSYSREGDRRPPPRDLPRDPYRPVHDTYIPARDRYDGRVYGRERDISSLSSHSPDRSRSPSSSSSSHRGKHRLPSRRSPAVNYSPPRRDYGVDRLHDQRMRDGGWERARHDDHNRWAAPLENDNYSRNDDRFRRPMRHSPRRDRSWDSYDREHPSHIEGGRDTDRDSYHTESYRSAAPRAHDDDRDDQYRPVSPGISHHPSQCPPSPSAMSPVHVPHTPPPPPSSPPPAPTPERPKDDTLPPHAAISIAIPLKRPPAPRDDHSPSPLPLPSAHEELVKEKKDTAVDATPRLPLVEQKRKRAPMQRTRKQELEAYGHVFLGCGQQSDYDATAKLGEGTFGEVHKAVQRLSGRLVALKRILMHNEKEGMPVTALREIKILKAMSHPCIIDILDMFVVRSNGKNSPLSVYMVFPYMDHDLAGLLENERVKLQPSHIKLISILHRDMKAANLLIDNNGSLRIADFGLARAYDPNVIHGITDQRGREKKYTNCVVTRWYRPPELLLGARQYGGEVDIWGIGCVLGEMFMRRPILPGSSDIDQLEKIWQLCGTPNQHTWPNYDALPGCEGVKRFNQTYSKKLRAAYESIGAETCDLLDKLLTCNPRDRITASQALDHDYFWTDPLPADPKTLPSYEASHEFDKRGRRNQPPPGIMPPDGYFRPHPLPHQPPAFYPRGPPHRPGPPPPPVIVSALLQHQGGGQHSGNQHPGGQHPGGAGYPSRGMHPPRQAPRAMDHPAHLPPRPMAPMGSGPPYSGRGPRRTGGGRHASGGSNATAGGGLPYS